VQLLNRAKQVTHLITIETPPPPHLKEELNVTCSLLACLSRVTSAHAH